MPRRPRRVWARVRRRVASFPPTPPASPRASPRTRVQPRVPVSQHAAPGHFAVGGAGISSLEIARPPSPVARERRRGDWYAPRGRRPRLAPDSRMTVSPIFVSKSRRRAQRRRAQTHLFGHSDDVHLVRFSNGRRTSSPAEDARVGRFSVDAPRRWRCVAVLRAERRRFDRSTSPPTARRWPSPGRTRGDDSSSPPGTSVSRARRRGGRPPPRRHNADYHARCVRFSPFEDDVLFACGRNSVRAYRLRKGKLGARASTSATSTCDTRPSTERGGRPETRKTPSRRRPPIRNSRRWRLRPRPSAHGQTAEDVRGNHHTGAVVQIGYPERRLECAYQLHDGAVNALCVSDGIAVSASDGSSCASGPRTFQIFSRGGTRGSDLRVSLRRRRARPRHHSRGIARRPTSSRTSTRRSRDRTRASSPPTPPTRTRPSLPPRPPTAPRGVVRGHRRTTLRVRRAGRTRHDVRL